MKWLVFAGEVIGFLSSVLLSWGLAPPKGTTTWVTNESNFDRNRRLRLLGARLGFAALAISFLIQAAVTLASN